MLRSLVPTVGTKGAYQQQINGSSRSGKVVCAYACLISENKEFLNDDVLQSGLHPEMSYKLNQKQKKKLEA